MKQTAMSKIAIIGPGAIGGTLAALLSEAHGTDNITLCVRSPFDRLVVETPSSSSAFRTIDLAPRILTEPKQVDHVDVDWIITATKTYDTEGAKRWIDALLGPSTIGVAIVQNGVEHMERFPEIVNRALPVIINLPAERTAPGRIRQRGAGTITVPDSDLGRKFVALFELPNLSLEAQTTSDFTTVAWKKLVVNSSGVVSALTLKPAGIVQHEKARALIRGIACETIAVGKAMGAKLDEEPQQKESLADEIVARLRASPPNSINSILADRLANRPTEVDARNGVIVRLGAKHGIPTPLNAMAVAILEIGGAGSQIGRGSESTADSWPSDASRKRSPA
jgi:2-dehydropantoate 2-reductase